MLMTRRTSLLGFTAAAAAPLILVRAAIAQTGDDYVRLTLEGGLFLKQSSQLALEKARSPMLQQFAELEVAEQTALAEVLASTGVTPPTAVDGEEATAMETLRAASGDAFDAAYLEAQIKGHREALQIQEPMASMSDITIPVAAAKLAAGHIRSHLAMLEMIETAMG